MENEFYSSYPNTLGRNMAIARATALSVLSVGFALFLNKVADELIQYLFPYRPVVPDLLFTLTPHLRWTEYLADIALILAVVSFTAYHLVRSAHKIPFYFTTITLGYLARAVFILLTPMGNPLDSGVSYGLLALPIEYGMFHSGHTMLMALLYLMADKKASALRLWLGLLVLVEIVALILSRGHYSIDIVGGLMVAYIVHDLCQKREKMFTLNGLQADSRLWTTRAK